MPIEHGKIRQTKGGEGNIEITVHEEHVDTHLQYQWASLLMVVVMTT